MGGFTGILTDCALPIVSKPARLARRYRKKAVPLWNGGVATREILGRQLVGRFRWDGELFEDGGR